MKLTVLCVVLLAASVCCIPEPGTFVVQFNKDQQLHAFYKSMYKESKIGVQVDCKKTKGMLNVRFVLRYSPCAEEYIGVESDPKLKMFYLNEPWMQAVVQFTYTKMEYITNVTEVDCRNGRVHFLPSFLSQEPTVFEEPKPTVSENSEKTGSQAAKSDEQGSKTDTTTKAPTKAAKDGQRSKRDTKTDPTKKDATKKGTGLVAPAQEALKNGTGEPTMKKDTEKDHQDMLKVWQDGYYVFVLQIVDSQNVSDVDVTVHMHGKVGFISAVDWPLLIFYGVMGIIYIINGLVWLVLLACSWRDLLRVQFWIGGVIVLGMLEKAVFYAEYQSIQATGQSVRGAIIFAELVSCMKRALARMLVIIVSLGFGIVKPRLGSTLHKVLAVGFIYFILASIEGCMRGLKSKGDKSSDQLIAEVPLAVTDASIVWWIFSSLVQTTRTLRLRRNVVKLSLYRHFTNTLIFAVLASVAYMLWSLTQHKLRTCVTDWRELWVDEAFWHLLFSVLLLVIMILWRPSANNQRYAFSPLLDAADDEDEPMMNDAFDGMKMRGVKDGANGKPKNRNSVDDDLKWVEENIPTSVTDKALPSLLDSDEEMMTTRYEVNKMQ